MNTLNRFSNLDDDCYESIDNNMNSFKPTKKSIAFKTTATVQDTTIKEFNITEQLFPSLTKTVKPVTNCLSFSNILTPKKEEVPMTNILEKEKEEKEKEEKEKEVTTNKSKDYFIAIFNKRTRRLLLPPPPKQKTEEEIRLELFINANHILNKLNALHIRRSKEYLLAWGEDDYIKTFISKEDVELYPFLKN